MKGLKKSVRTLQSVITIDTGMLRKNRNILMCLMVVLILLAKRLRPMFNSMIAKATLVLLVCYLAMADLCLGLLGVIFFAAVNNGIMEGMKEGEEEEEGEEDAGLKEGEDLDVEGMDHEEDEEEEDDTEGK